MNQPNSLHGPPALSTLHGPSALTTLHGPSAPITLHGPSALSTLHGPSALITIEGNNFATEVLAAEVPVLVEFMGAWCGPCRVQKPILAELAREGAGRYKVCIVDVDANPALATRYGIRAAPTLMVFRNGEPVANRVGLTQKPALRELLGVDALAATRP